MPEALPAVTVPSLANAAFSPASFSAVVPGRGYSSFSIRIGSPFFCGISTATISLLKAPASINEIAVCLGQQGNPRGWFRHLRNLNPRYEADSWLPAGGTLNATTKIVGL